MRSDEKHFLKFSKQHCCIFHVLKCHLLSILNILNLALDAFQVLNITRSGDNLHSWSWATRAIRLSRFKSSLSLSFFLKNKKFKVASRFQACCIIFIYTSWPSVLYTSSIAFPDCCQWYAFCQSEKGFSNIWDEVADSMTERNDGRGTAWQNEWRLSDYHNLYAVEPESASKSPVKSQYVTWWGFDPRTWPVPPEKDLQGNALGMRCELWLFGSVWRMKSFNPQKVALEKCYCTHSPGLTLEGHYTTTSHAKHSGSKWL